MRGQIGTAVIGVGGMGSVHAMWSYILPESDLKAVCDINEDRAKEIAAKYKCDWYTDYHKMLERKDIDAVIVVTPNLLHAPIAIDVVKAGKHVAVEKPLTVSLKDAGEMIKAVKKAGVHDAYFENLPFSPSYSMARQIIDAGGLGEVYFARVNECGGNGLQSLKPLKDAKKYFGMEWGYLLQGGCHPIQLSRVLFDREPAKRVFAAIRHYKHPDPKIDDTALLTIEFEGGQIAWIDACIYALGTFDDRAEIYGTKGSIFVDLYRQNPLTVYSQVGYGTIGAGQWGMPGGIGTGWGFPIPDEERSLGYFHEQQAWLNSLIKDEEHLQNFEDGRATLEIIFAAYKSGETGNAVSLPLAE